MSHLIDVTELSALQESGRRVRVLDVRWRLDQPEGRPDYLLGRIPTAVYVDLERELASPGHPESGRHPLPPLGQLESTARRWGICQGDLVVAYDDNDGIPAARLWWLLRRRGVNVRVLDGGLRAWIQSGRHLDTGDYAPAFGDVTLTDGDPGVATIDETARAPIDGVLVDVRAPQHYRGVAASIDPIGGHVPGAVNLPAVTHIAADGRLKSADDVRAAAASIGVEPEVPVILYCSSGIASSHTALALSEAGIESRVFPGSWSQWSRSPGRPVAVGTHPAQNVVGTPRQSAGTRGVRHG